MYCAAIEEPSIIIVGQEIMQHIPNSRLACSGQSRCRSGFFLVANIDCESPLLGAAGPLLIT